MLKRDNKKYHKNFYYLFILILFIIFPILQIFIGFKYKNEITCETKTFGNLGNWFITQGFITGLLSFLILINKQCENDYISYSFYILSLFTFIWIIIGSVVYFENCIDFTPVAINIFLWVCLIIAFIMLIKAIQINKKTIMNSRQRPLLSL